jgi:competence protein ComEC
VIVRYDVVVPGLSQDRNLLEYPAGANPLAELVGPMTAGTGSVMLGIMAGHWFAWLWGWLVLSVMLTGVMFWMFALGRARGVRVWGVLALIALSASWLIVRSDHTTRYDLSQYIGETSQLARVAGEIIEPASTGSQTGGTFAGFNYESPSTRFVMRVREIEVSGRWLDTHGDLLVRIDQADHRPRTGMRIEATGWLGAVFGPRNVGEYDYRAYLAGRGVVGRLTLRNRDNWKRTDQLSPTIGGTLRTIRSRCSDAALRSLRLGMSGESGTTGLLETMLLGRKDRSGGGVREAFRRVGLAHLLSISGAHLGILMGLVWLVARWFVPNPPRAALIVLVVLGLYLMAVPLRVPIVRSGIMAGLFCAAYGTGRRVRPVQVLLFAAFVVLLWRPMDLFTPGFQLSFGAVAGLILFVPTVSGWLWPRPIVLPGHLGAGWVIGRWCVDYLSVSLVAFAVIAPLVAYHFQMVNPLSVLLSIMALPVLTGVLGLGYFKILIGLFLPSAGLLLSGPLSWLGDSLRGLVDHAGGWPGALILLVWRPSVGWTVGVSVLVLSVLSGVFAGRRGALIAAVCVMVLWTVVGQSGRSESWLGDKKEETPAALLTMLAVGDGSCYLLQLPGETVMFDCGSQQYFDIAESSIVPTLKRMGVTRIDTLILSHADMDHYNGSLDLVDALAVGRVLVPGQLLAEAQEHPDSATAYLVEGLRDRGLAATPIARGWSESVGEAEMKVLWPPADFAPRRANDTSVVLSVRVAGRRMLLNGDIQGEAIERLMELENLSADITDLPHHGSVVDASGGWIAAVGPSVVLQSSGRARLYHDKWLAILEGKDILRLVTAREGMGQVRVERDGRIDYWWLLRDYSPPE